MSDWCYLNGRFRAFSDTGLSLADAGFTSGATVVDNARTYGGTLFRWTDHLARFRRDCAECDIPLTVSNDELTAVAVELIRRNHRDDGSELHVVTFATPGVSALYPDGPDPGPTLGLVTYPVRPERYRRFFTDGVTLAVAGTQTSSPTDLLPPRVKHRSRLHWHVADERVKRTHPGAVAVILNNGVPDTAIGTVFGVSGGGELVVPPRGLVQDGISLTVCRELVDWPVREQRGPFSPGDYEELLLTGTGFGVVRVSRWRDALREHVFGGTGRVYGELLARWSALIGRPIDAEFLSVALDGRASGS